jgi:hypothetical protein
LSEVSQNIFPYKIGELPIYGPPTPARLISLIGPDREIFLKGIAFTYDAARNVFICPQGKTLRHRTARNKTRIHTYRAHPTDCRNCPIRQQCTRSNKRSLSVPFDEAARQEIIALQANTGEFKRI